MASLAETNPHLRDPEARRRLLERNARSSSAFEGARGLKPIFPSPQVKTSRKKSVKAP
jgi:hypothetical protein